MGAPPAPPAPEPASGAACARVVRGTIARSELIETIDFASEGEWLRCFPDAGMPPSAAFGNEEARSAMPRSSKRTQVPSRGPEVTRFLQRQGRDAGGVVRRWRELDPRNSAQGGARHLDDGHQGTEVGRARLAPRHLHGRREQQGPDRPACVRREGAPPPEAAPSPDAASRAHADALADGMAAPLRSRGPRCRPRPRLRRRLPRCRR